MIAWWWLIPAVIGGAMFGVFMIALANASWKDDER